MGSMWPLSRIAAGKLRPKLTLLAHEGFPYPAALRRAVLAAMNASTTSTAELARLNWRLGLAYAEAVTATAKRHRLKLELVGCHGQTLYHQAHARDLCGQEIRLHVAGRRGSGDRSGFAGVPLSRIFGRRTCLPADRVRLWFRCSTIVLFSDAKRGRVLQNIGGIANLTAIPARGGSR